MVLESFEKLTFKQGERHDASFCSQYIHIACRASWKREKEKFQFPHSLRRRFCPNLVQSRHDHGK